MERAFRPRRNRIVVQASATDLKGALHLLQQLRPDVAIISAHLQEGPLEGYRMLRELRAFHLRTRTIMLLSSRDREFVIDAFRCGAHGIVFRDEPLETLGKCIHAVHRGQVWANSEQLGYMVEALGHTLPARLGDSRLAEMLSRRERDVVTLVAEGLTNRDISTQLGLSEHTIRNYLFRIFDKTGVSTRVELVLCCLQERQSGSTAQS